MLVFKMLGGAGIYLDLPVRLCEFHGMGVVRLTMVVKQSNFMGRWRSWLSHLSNTQKVLSSNLGRLMVFDGSF